MILPRFSQVLRLEIITEGRWNIGPLTVLFQRWRWQPAPVLLPGESHGRRSLVDCSPWGRKESDTAECLHFTHFLLYHWRGKRQATPVLLPGESHGRRSLAGHGPWGCRGSDTTEVTMQQQRGPFPFSLFLFISEQKGESVGRMHTHQEVKNHWVSFAASLLCWWEQKGMHVQAPKYKLCNFDYSAYKWNALSYICT